MKNPFYPSYGNSPKVFLGRESIMRDFIYGIENGPGDPNRATIITGPRGSGKTVVLRELQSEIMKQGWIPIYVSQSKRLLENIMENLLLKCSEILEKENNSKITGVQFGKLGFTREFVKNQEISFEMKFMEIIKKIQEANSGIVIEIDEIQGNSEELRRVANLFQTLKGEGYPIAMILAGLPHEVDRVFNDKVISFVRRSRLKHLELLSDSEVFQIFKRTFKFSEKAIDDDACLMLTKKSGGYPYLIQLLGYETWEISEDNQITLKEAIRGLEHAKPYISSSMIELIILDISPTDLEFLMAMSVDEKESKVADISERLNLTSNSVSQYRLRLIKEGIIRSTERGCVDFTIPYMREYLRQKEENFLL